MVNNIWANLPKKKSWSDYNRSFKPKISLLVSKICEQLLMNDTKLISLFLKSNKLNIKEKTPQEGFKHIGGVQGAHPIKAPK